MTAESLPHTHEPNGKSCPKCGEAIPPPIKPITARQKEVIERLAIGEDLNQAAATMNVCRKTVEKHVQLAKARTGSRTLPHLVATAIKTGLITV